MIIFTLLRDDWYEMIWFADLCRTLNLLQGNLDFCFIHARLQWNSSSVHFSLQKPKFIRLVKQYLNWLELFPNRDFNWRTVFVFADQTSAFPIFHQVNLDNPRSNKVVDLLINLILPFKIGQLELSLRLTFGFEPFVLKWNVCLKKTYLFALGLDLQLYNIRVIIYLYLQIASLPIVGL